MELQTEDQPSRQNLPENSFKLAIKKMGSWDEEWWPILSLIFLIRPLHHWLVGQVAKIEKGQKVLEVGSGYPLYKLYANKVGENGVFAAVDINQKVQRRSRKICYRIDNFFKKDDSKNTPVTQIVANASRLPFGDNCFDTVIASNFNTLYSYTNEAYRVLKPGGRAIFTWVELFSVPILSRTNARICKELGFENVKIKPGMPASIIPGELWNWHVEATKPK